MQKDTKKRAAILCAAAAVGFMLFYIATIVFAVLSEAMGDIAGMFFIGIFVAVFLAMIVGVLFALRQRIREIDGGEEEDAKKY